MGSVYVCPRVFVFAHKGEMCMEAARRKRECKSNANGVYSQTQFGQVLAVRIVLMVEGSLILVIRFACPVVVSGDGSDERYVSPFQCRGCELQVGSQQFSELVVCFMEMRFDRAFAPLNTCCNRFDREFLCVAEVKDFFPHLTF